MQHLIVNFSLSVPDLYTFAEFAEFFWAAKAVFCCNAVKQAPLSRPTSTVSFIGMPSNSLKHLSHCVVSIANLYAQLPGVWYYRLSQHSHSSATCLPVSAHLPGSLKASWTAALWLLRSQWWRSCSLRLIRARGIPPTSSIFFWDPGSWEEAFAMPTALIISSEIVLPSQVSQQDQMS